MGNLSCLNVSGGDIEISFDTNDSAEAIRAKRMIKDMLRRGYALLVKMADGTYIRALDFDEKQSSYVIADYDSSIEENSNEQIETETKTPSPSVKKQGKRQRQRIPMAKASTVAIAPSAGG